MTKKTFVVFENMHLELSGIKIFGLVFTTEKALCNMRISAEDIKGVTTEEKHD